MNNLIAFAIFCALEAVIAVSSAYVMVNDRKGWGWLIFLGVLLLCCVRIKDDPACETRSGSTAQPQERGPQGDAKADGERS